MANEVKSNQPETGAIQVIEEQGGELAIQASNSTYEMLMDEVMFKRVESIATMMSKGVATVPKHLRGSKEDCFAVALQSMSWGMSPFQVAQKTHITPGGQLGYEAQLINAVVIARAPIKKRPDFEFIGDWDKILGKVEKRKSTREGGGDYYVGTWKDAEEEGLGVICRATMRGEDKPRELKLMLKQCWPRFSTQWAMDPQQQITYAAVRKWARRNTPDVLLGVYTTDELMDIDDEVAPPTDITPPSNNGGGNRPTGNRGAPDKNGGLTDRQIADWEAASRKGKDASRAFWQALTAEQRARAPGELKDRMWKLAEKTDLERTVDVEPKAGEAQAADATAAPAAAPASAASSTEKAADGDGVIDPEFVRQMDEADAAARAQRDPGTTDGTDA